MKLIKTLAPALIATLALTGVASNVSASTSGSVQQGYSQTSNTSEEIRVGFFDLSLSEAKKYAKANYSKTKTEYLKEGGIILGNEIVAIQNGLLYTSTGKLITSTGDKYGNSMMTFKNGEIMCADGAKTFKLYVTDNSEGGKSKYLMLLNVYDGKILSMSNTDKLLPTFNVDYAYTSYDEALYSYTASIKKKIANYASKNKKSNGTNYVKNVNFLLDKKVSDSDKFKAYKGYIYQYNGKGKYVKFTGKFNSTGKQISVKKGIVYADKSKPYTGQVQFKQKVKKYKATNLYLNGGKVVKVTQSSGTTNLR